MWQRIVGQKFQLNCSQRMSAGGPPQSVGVFFWPVSADPIRTVGLPLERGLARRKKRLGLPIRPDRGPQTALVRPLPNLVTGLGRFQQVRLTPLQLTLLVHPALPPDVHRRVPIKDPIRPFDAGEHGLQRVIIGLWNRIELVVMASGTVNRGAVEHREDRADHVVAIHVST